MCLAELRANAHCRVREQDKELNKVFNNIFEMVPHWPGIIEIEGRFQLTQKLLTKEDLLENEDFLRLAFELPPIMLPRRIKP